MLAVRPVTNLKLTLVLVVICDKYVYIPLGFFIIPWQFCLLSYIVKGMCSHIFAVFFFCLKNLFNKNYTKCFEIMNTGMFLILMLSQFCWTCRCLIYLNAYSCYEVCYVVNWCFCNLWGLFFFWLASGILCWCLVVYTVCR